MTHSKSHAQAQSMGILEPQERLRVLTNYSNAVEIDPSVPPRRCVFYVTLVTCIYVVCINVGIIGLELKWYEWQTCIWKKAA